MCAGGVEGLGATYRALLDAGEEVLVPEPGWPNLRTLAVVCGAEPVGYPVPAQGRTVVEPDVLEGLRTPRTRALVVNSPSDPTAGGLEPPRSSGCSGGPPGTTSGWSPTGAPFYLWLAHRDPRPSAQLARDLVLEPGVTLAPRDAFGPAGAGHLRVSLATATQPLVEGPSRVVAALG